MNDADADNYNDDLMIPYAINMSKEGYQWRPFESSSDSSLDVSTIQTMCDQVNTIQDAIDEPSWPSIDEQTFDDALLYIR
jgi:hypothetical protein